MASPPPRLSVTATYDSRETGPRYWVTTELNDRPLGFRHPIADPFVRQTVTIAWSDLLRALFRRRPLTVVVTVGGPGELMDDVLELDANTVLPGRTRHAEVHRQVSREARYARR